MARVLVVADDIWVENDVRSALTDSGTELLVTGDGREAVPTAVEHSPVTAVVDFQIGSMGGMAVIRALRSAMATGEIPKLRTVLLLDRTADAFLARRAGADAAVLKPFTAQELRAATALTAGV